MDADDFRDYMLSFQFRKVNGDETDEEKRRYARRVSLEEIEKNDYNLNISRYVSTAKPEHIIDIQAVNEELVSYENDIVNATNKHNAFLKELGLAPLPLAGEK